MNSIELIFFFFKNFLFTGTITDDSIIIVVVIVNTTILVNIKTIANIIITTTIIAVIRTVILIDIIIAEVVTDHVHLLDRIIVTITVHHHQVTISQDIKTFLKLERRLILLLKIAMKSHQLTIVGKNRESQEILDFRTMATIIEDMVENGMVHEAVTSITQCLCHVTNVLSLSFLEQQTPASTLVSMKTFPWKRRARKSQIILHPSMISS